MNNSISVNNLADPIARACDILAEVARNRSASYRYIALCLYPPDQELIGMLISRAVANALLQSTAWLGEEQVRLIDAIIGLGNCTQISCESLSNEYSRLLERGIERISPYESSYRWQSAQDLINSSDDLRRALQHQYLLRGVQATSGMEDHVAVEIEYLSFLCDKEATMWQAKDHKAAHELRSQERNFINDHLSHWLPEFCKKLNDRALIPFYQYVADFSDQWLSLDSGPGYQSLPR